MEGPREESFLYTPREAKRLKKSLGRAPLGAPTGRGICPFCLHVEARWRTLPDREAPGAFEVRVLCSQCQRRLVYRLEG